MVFGIGFRSARLWVWRIGFCALSLQFLCLAPEVPDGRRGASRLCAGRLAIAYDIV